MSDSSQNNNPRKRAAAARAAQLAAEKRRERTTRIVIIAIVLVVVGGIIGGALFFSQQDAPGPNPSAASPKGVDSATYGYLVNSTAKTTTIPQVQLWEDFQCPACKQFEDAGSSAALQAAALKGEINLQMRPTIFLDAKLQNDASALATNAWGCAIDAGKALAYHNEVFKNQPAEGGGYTQDQLVTFGKNVGITGDPFTAFDTCTKGQQFSGWVSNSQAAFVSENVPGTPTIYVNGKKLDAKIYLQPAELLKAIQAAAK